MSKLGFNPLSAYIWLEFKEPEEIVLGGLILPGKKASNEGKIVAIGAFCDIEVQKRLKIGDSILYDPTVVKRVNVRGKDFLLLVDRNVTAVFVK